MAIVAGFGAFLALKPASALAQAAQDTVQAPGAVDTGMLYIAELVLKLSSVVTTVMVAILDVAIKLMSYNGFVDSPVVSAGWAIVRDTVNMFFVVVLIAIALGTIFGYHKFQWQSQVPRLMLFALVINFSKTACGIMIDIGQVVMLTFANALQAVAAGNFIQMFALSQGNLSVCIDPTGVTCGVGSFQVFAGALAGLLASMWVLVTVLILVAILAWRIVMLWVLIAIAPLAWFVGGARGITSSHAYEDWWKKFTCAVAVGPILTFFLWLTLAVAGAGNLAASKGFEAFSQSQKVADTIPIQLFEPVHLMTFIIAMAMLYAGFQAASDFCGGASGFVGGLLKKGEGAGKAMALFGAGTGAAIAARGGRFGLRKTKEAAGWTGRNLLAPTLEKGKYTRWLTDKGRETGAREMAAGSKNTMFGRVVGSLAGGFADKKAAERKEKSKEVLARTQGMSAENLQNQAVKLAEMKGSPLTKDAQKNGAAIYAATRANKEAWNALSEDQKSSLDAKFGKDAKELVKGNKELMDKMVDQDIQDLDITKNYDALNKDNIWKIGKRAFAKLYGDEKFRAKLASITTEKIDKETGMALNALEAVEKGLYGREKMEAFGPGGAEKYYKSLDQNALMKTALADLAANFASVNPSIIEKEPGIAARVLSSADPRTAEALAKPANYAAAMKGIGIDADGNVSDSKRFESFVKENPLALGNIKPETLSAQGVAAMGVALGPDQASKIVAAYKKASPDERKRLTPMVNNALSSLRAMGTESSDAGVKDASAKLASSISTQIDAVRAKDGSGSLDLASREADYMTEAESAARRLADLPDLIGQKEGAIQQIEAEAANHEGAVRDLEGELAKAAAAADEQAQRALNVQTARVRQRLVEAQARLEQAKQDRTILQRDLDARRRTAAATEADKKQV